jgi:CYTH domain-containing protein/predicted ATPase
MKLRNLLNIERRKVKEREVKYLPENQHFGGKGGTIIRQVYLDLSHPKLLETIKLWLPQADIENVAEARVRCSESAKKMKFTLTTKSAGGEVREEQEVEIGSKHFDELLKFGPGGEIEKERFEQELAEGLVAEVDVYNGNLKGLVTVEVEYDQERHSRLEVEMLLEKYFGQGEIVSEYQCYKNKSLANLKDLDEVQDRYLREKEMQNSDHAEVMLRTQVKKIALTGGPCAGKSEVLEALKAEFGDKLYVLSEVATQLLEVPYEQGGVGIPGKDVDWSQEWQDSFQRQIIEKQLEKEMLLTQIASLDQEGAVLLCDRGVLDGAAYTDGGREKFLKQHKLELEKCFELYDAVIHLNSLATDNPKMYEDLLHTNPSRFEDGETARALDESIARAYSGHEALIRISTQPTIEDKILYCSQVVEKVGRIKRENDKNLEMSEPETKIESCLETRQENVETNSLN